MPEKTVLVKMPPEVIEIYKIASELERKYPGRPFTPDGHMVGSLGEVIAAETEEFGLQLLPVGTKWHDAVNSEGRKVQIKLTGGRSVALRATCDWLLAMRIMPDRMHAEVVYNGPGAPVWEACGGLNSSNGQRMIEVSKLRKMSETNPRA
jgi:hypothetical protein